MIDPKQKAALGQPISRLDKIATLKTLEEIDGFAWGAGMSGQELTTQEQAALTTRASEIMKAAAKNKRGKK